MVAGARNTWCRTSCGRASCAWPGSDYRVLLSDRHLGPIGRIRLRGMAHKKTRGDAPRAGAALAPVQLQGRVACLFDTKPAPILVADFVDRGAAELEFHGDCRIRGNHRRLSGRGASDGPPELRGPVHVKKTAPSARHATARRPPHSGTPTVIRDARDAKAIRCPRSPLDPVPSLVLPAAPGLGSWRDVSPRGLVHGLRVPGVAR